MASWPYNTQRWQKLRRLKLRRSPLCARCHPRVVAAVDVHHVHAIRNGGDPWGIDGLEALCHQCHSKVTRYEQLGRAVPVRGCDPATGLPLDPGHPWNQKDCSTLTPPDRRGTSGET